MAYFPMGGQTYTLQSSISSTQTTITLSSFKVPVSGDDITMALMNTSIAYATIAPRTSNSEFISFTGITQNSDGTATLTGVTRGLNKTYPGTENTDFKLPHAGATQFILSDAPQVLFKYDVIENDVTITGRKQFPAGGSASAAVVGVTYSAPTQDNEVATKKYIDDIAISGSPNATTAVKGIVELPTQAEVEAATSTGGTGASLVLTNNQYGARNNIGYASGSGSPNTYTVTVTPTPTGYATGQIVGVLMPNQNTGNATLNVNGLGAKTIRLGGTGLFAGAFATNSVVGLQYNGSSFDIIESSDLISASATANKVVLRDNTGDIALTTSFTSVISSFSITTATTTTTTIAVGFLPTNVTVYFRMTGRNNLGAAMYTNGAAFYTGTTLKAVQLTSNNVTTTETYSPAVNTTPPKAGDNNGTNNGIDITLSLTSVTSTQVTVGLVSTKTGSPTAATADLFIVANK